MPVDVVADLEADAGEPLITRELAALTGHVLVRLPQAVACRGRWVRHMADVVGDASAIARKLATALENDGKITAQEARDLAILADIREAMEGLAAIEADVRAVKAGEVRDE